MPQPLYHASKTLILMFLFSTLAACHQVKPGAAALAQLVDLYTEHLPNVAAEYITTRVDDSHEHDAEEEVVNWRFWRDSNQVTTERPQLAVGELWQLDGKTIIHRKLYHADQRAIEFQDDDLRMMESLPSRQKLRLLVDTKLLEQLTVGDVDWGNGYPTRAYRGERDGAEWHVVMRLDLALPVLIERHHRHGLERTELVSAYSLNQAPWQPKPSNRYEIIDFADLGDKEYDPFVRRVQSQMGQHHHH